MPSLSDLIDKVLDWIEEQSGTMAPLAIDGLVCCEAETRMLLD
ncbi:MAG TPA: hypothetical protein VKR55_11500 [Bradyrhizobium sp.]|nr:hypothetical protein [Bradyrhizobium sp.]HLZ02762.1 hypothetical protein [Bradyrhizobium sp.]